MLRNTDRVNRRIYCLQTSLNYLPYSHSWIGASPTKPVLFVKFPPALSTEKRQFLCCSHWLFWSKIILRDCTWGVWLCLTCCYAAFTSLMGDIIILNHQFTNVLFVCIWFSSRLSGWLCCLRPIATSNCSISPLLHICLPSQVAYISRLCLNLLAEEDMALTSLFVEISEAVWTLYILVSWGALHQTWSIWRDLLLSSCAREVFCSRFIKH